MPSPRRGARRALAGTAGLAVALTGISVVGSAPASAAATGLVISEVYGGGGNGGAIYTHDFVELYNPTSAPISLAGTSLQYRSTANTAAAGTISSLDAAGSVPPGEHFVVQLASQAAVGVPVPNVDFVGSSTFNLGGSNGQVFLADSLTGVDADGAGNTTVSDPAVVDFVGYGTAAIKEGATAAPAPTGNSASITRNAAGTDTGVNGADFTVASPPTPGEPAGDGGPADPTAATIPEIQGSGTASPMVGDLVETEGVVTAAYPSGLFGFYLQTPGTGGAVDLATHTTSDAVFVYYPVGAGNVAVQPGDHVSVTGTVGEYAGATQIVSSAAGTTVLPTAAAVTPTTTATWPATAAQKESLEGMLYDPADSFTVTDTYSTAQYGEVGLAVGAGPLLQPTEVAKPGTPEADAVEAQNAARAIVLDDASSTNYANSSSSNDYTPTNGDLTPPYVSKTEPVRVGAPATITGPVILTEGGSTSAPTYRFQPLTTVVGPASAGSPLTVQNTRTAAPEGALIDPAGTADVRIASFNVLNYFTTLGDADDDNVGDGGCLAYNDADGDGNNTRTGCDQRGAWDAADLARQQEKIVAAINALDADVVGLMEIENSLVVDGTADEATQTLVTALNAAAGAGTWAANPSSTDLPAASEMDVISNAIIYKPAAVSRVGDARALGTLSEEDQAFGNAREPIAQAFKPTGGGSPFTLVVNHFKSKGSAGPWPGDTDQGDGQGAGNVSRVKQAEALRDWVAGLAQSSGIAATALVGDFNSYGQEDPMQVLYAAGFTDVESQAVTKKYSYSFDGLSGSLDHVLVNAALKPALTGADVWGINSGESLAFEYSRFNYHSTDFHEATPYRSSDHDPVVAGLDLLTPPAPGKVKSKVKLKVKPAKPTAGKSRVTVVIKVTGARGIKGTGPVQLTVTGKSTKTVRLKNGKATLKLGKLSAGKKKLVAYYGGSDLLTSGKDTVKITVRKK